MSQSSPKSSLYTQGSNLMRLDVLTALCPLWHHRNEVRPNLSPEMNEQRRSRSASQYTHSADMGTPLVGCWCSHWWLTMLKLLLKARSPPVASPSPTSKPVLLAKCLMIKQKQKTLLFLIL